MFTIPGISSYHTTLQIKETSDNCILIKQYTWLDIMTLIICRTVEDIWLFILNVKCTCQDILGTLQSIFHFVWPLFSFCLRMFSSHWNLKGRNSLALILHLWYLSMEGIFLVLYLLCFVVSYETLSNFTGILRLARGTEDLFYPRSQGPDPKWNNLEVLRGSQVI